MITKRKRISFIVVFCCFVFGLFSLNCPLLIAQNTSTTMNSGTNDRDLNYVSKSDNSSNDTINTYSNLAISSSSSNFYDLNAKDKVIHVTLDIFSGRPNPTWVLTKEQTILFLNNVSQIKPNTDNLQSYQEKILGYRGFIADEKTNNDLASKNYEIYNGTIKVYSNDSSFFLKDKDSRLEKWLLQTAYRHVDDDTFNFVKEDMANRK